MIGEPTTPGPRHGLTALSVGGMRLAVPTGIVAGVRRGASGALVVTCRFGNRTWEIVTQEAPRAVDLAAGRVHAVPGIIRRAVPFAVEVIVVDESGHLLLIPAFPLVRQVTADLSSLVGRMVVEPGDLVLRIGEVPEHGSIVVRTDAVLEVTRAPELSPLPGSRSGLFLWRGRPALALSVADDLPPKRCVVVRLDGDHPVGFVTGIAGPLERIPFQAEPIPAPPSGPFSGSVWQFGSRRWSALDGEYLRC